MKIEHATHWLRISVPLLSLMLAGCFAGGDPLITASTASTPFKDGALITEYGSCEGPAGAIMGCKGYVAKGTSALALAYGVYTLHPDPSDDNAQALAQQYPSGEMTMMFRDIGDGDYVVQIDMGGEKKEMSADRYVFELITFDGKVGYVYQLNCEQVGDAAYVRSGLLKEIDTTMLPTCRPSNLANLTVILKQRLAAGIKPDSKFVVAG
jgi:hypothetical protein